eukprot:5624735-Pyramimonas_sp.AAC.1
MLRRQKRLESSCPSFLVGDLSEATVSSPAPRAGAEGATLPPLGQFTSVIASAASRRGRCCPTRSTGAAPPGGPPAARARDLRRWSRVGAGSRAREAFVEDSHRARGQISRTRSTARLNQALKTKRSPGRPRARPRIPELNWTRDDAAWTVTAIRQKLKMLADFFLERCGDASPPPSPP